MKKRLDEPKKLLDLSVPMKQLGRRFKPPPTDTYANLGPHRAYTDGYDHGWADAVERLTAPITGERTGEQS